MLRQEKETKMPFKIWSILLSFKLYFSAFISVAICNVALS